MSKNVRVILQACKKPQKFSELKKLVPISKVSLYENLKRLQEKGLIEKLPDGRYILTEEGKKLAEEIEVYELVREILAREGARQFKTDLEFKIRLDRQPRAVALVNMLKILLLIRYASYVGLVSLSMGDETDLNLLIDAVVKKLRGWGVDIFLDRTVRELMDEKLIEYNREELERKKQLRLISKRELINRIEWIIGQVKDLQEKIDLEKIDADEKRFASQVSQIVDVFLEKAREKIEEYRSPL